MSKLMSKLTGVSVSGEWVLLHRGKYSDVRYTPEELSRLIPMWRTGTAFDMPEDILTALEAAAKEAENNAPR